MNGTLESSILNGLICCTSNYKPMGVIYQFYTLLRFTMEIPRAHHLKATLR